MEDDFPLNQTGNLIIKNNNLISELFYEYYKKDTYNQNSNCIYDK